MDIIIMGLSNSTTESVLITNIPVSSLGKERFSGWRLKAAEILSEHVTHFKESPRLSILLESHCFLLLAVAAVLIARTLGQFTSADKFLLPGLHPSLAVEITTQLRRGTRLTNVMLPNRTHSITP